MVFDYDVALSFAGEDRHYVERVARMLHEIGIKVFYDEYNEVELWGKNLYDELDDVYQRKAKYCVIFISRHYKEKAWANHERQSAQASALRDTGNYILPVRFDDTEIPGIRHTVKFIDANKYKPKELAYLIAEKVNPDSDVNSLIEVLNDYLTDYKIYIKGTNVVFECEKEDYYNEFPLRLLLEMYKIGQLEYMFLLPSLVPH